MVDRPLWGEKFALRPPSSGSSCPLLFPRMIDRGSPALARKIRVRASELWSFLLGHPSSGPSCPLPQNNQSWDACSGKKKSRHGQLALVLLVFFSLSRGRSFAYFPASRFLEAGEQAQLKKRFIMGRSGDCLL